MIAYDAALPLIGLHLPKTAGTSLRWALERWFPAPRLKLHYRIEGEPPPKHDLRGGDCVYGHFNATGRIGVSDYYPDAAQFFCFLREPFDRFVSQWRFLQPFGDPADLLGFERWLLIRGDEQRDGVNRHSFVWHLPAKPGTQPIEPLLRERFVFVGLCERLQSSLDGLAATLGQESVPAPRLNVTQAATANFERFRPAFERLFADEMEIYAAGAKANGEAPERRVNPT